MTEIASMETIFGTSKLKRMLSHTRDIFYKVLSFLFILSPALRVLANKKGWSDSKTGAGLSEWCRKVEIGGR